MDRRLTVSIILTLFVSFQYEVFARSRSSLRIINGTIAAEGEFPYMVQLRNSYGFYICGGGILSSEWILTAGHCVENGLIDSIVYGTNKLYDYGDGYPNTSIKVKNWFQHPKFTTNDTGIRIYDVGILQLEEPISFDDNAQPIHLAVDNINIPFHIQGVLSGWGVNESYDGPTQQLQKIYLQLLTDDECKQKINAYSEDESFNPIHNFCSDDYYNGECFGDTGSPYVINGTQYGIVSWSFKPCGIVPGTYSRITNPEYRDWIRNVTNI